MYDCRVERDSISPGGVRCLSFVVTYPRAVLAEVVTHRVVSDNWGYESFCERTTTKDISKNSASSRAIPFNKMVEKVKQDPFMPFWTMNQSGMQGKLVEDQEILLDMTNEWLHARNDMIDRARRLDAMGAHKQDVNRLLEPWMWVTQIVTSTRWDNFFALRCHKAAHPAFQRIARMMFLARRKSVPNRLDYGQWHLPFTSEEDTQKLRWHPEINGDYPKDLPDLIKFSAARCAWLSYENHDKDGSPEQMLRTFDRLFAEVPIHASPCEHQCTPLHIAIEASNPRLRSNLTGYLQARKLIKLEEITEYNPSEEEVASWEILN